MILAITGGRDVTPTTEELEHLGVLAADRAIELVVHGDCPTGVDRSASRHLAKLGYRVLPFPANWKTYGRAAGPIRNSQMVMRLGRNGTLAAWPGGRGTADMVRRCENASVDVIQMRK